MKPRESFVRLGMSGDVFSLVGKGRGGYWDWVGENVPIFFCVVGPNMNVSSTVLWCEL